MESIVNQSKIHFYQYLQVQLLQQYIRSGIYYLINTLITSSDKFISLRYYTSQITTLIDFFKDYYMLKIHQSTFAENFYQLQRQRENSQPIQPFKNALIWSLLPYIIQKLQNLYNSLKNQQQEGRQLPLLLKSYVNLFPYLYAVISIANVLMKFRYLMDQKSQFYDLVYWICKVKTGYQQIQNDQYSYPLFQFFKSPGMLVLLLGHKVLNWYYSSLKKKRQLSQVQGKREVKSPFISAKQNEQQKDKLQIDKGKCPICGQDIDKPAFLKCSGYTFCHSCIVEYVKGYQRCPMTKIKCSIDNVQVIYN